MKLVTMNFNIFKFNQLFSYRIYFFFTILCLNFVNTVSDYFFIIENL